MWHLGDQAQQLSSGSNRFASGVSRRTAGDYCGVEVAVDEASVDDALSVGMIEGEAFGSMRTVRVEVALVAETRDEAASYGSAFRDQDCS